MTTSIKNRFEGAAGLIGGDLDEEHFHLAELRVAHFVSSLGQPERLTGHKRQGKRFPDRFGPDAQRVRFGKSHRQCAIREDDLEILIEAGGELGAFNFIQLQHERISHEGHKGAQRKNEAESGNQES